MGTRERDAEAHDREAERDDQEAAGQDRDAARRDREAAAREACGAMSRAPGASGPQAVRGVVRACAGEQLEHVRAVWMAISSCSACRCAGVASASRSRSWRARSSPRAALTCSVRLARGRSPATGCLPGVGVGGLPVPDDPRVQLLLHGQPGWFQVDGRQAAGLMSISEGLPSCWAIRDERLP
jgi:hypothetical protein